MTPSKRVPCILLALAALALFAPARADFDEQFSFGDRLELNNLIGKVDVVGHGGSAIEVSVHVRGKDGTRQNIALDRSGEHLSVKFPVSESRKYVYPEMGSGSRTTFSPDSGDDSWLARMLGSGKRITVSGTGSGMEVWADVEIRVPDGGTVTVKLGVGAATATSVDGNITLSTSSGRVEARKVSGKLVADTGSGHVEVEDIDGQLLVDTGSGHVQATRIRGNDVNIDTGSGHVEVDDVDCRKLLIDTGSGRVKASGVRTDSASIDTGSGGIELNLDRMGAGTYDLDTGSGRIRLRIPRGASAEVVAETGSGGIDLDLDEPVVLQRKESDEVRFTLGGGAARVRLDTGSGGITITDR